MNTVEAIIERPYTKVVRRDEDGDFIARVLELPGCVADGETEAAALESLADAQKLWITSALKAGTEIPEPAPDDDVLPSGKWVQRVPRTLHQTVTHLAESDGVSLNQWVTTVLAVAAGRRTVVPPCERASLTARAQSTPIFMWMSDNFEHSYNANASQNWAVETIPHWTPKTTVPLLADEALSYLTELANDYPNRWQAEGTSLIGAREMINVHGRHRLPAISEKRTTVRSGTRLLQHKS